VEPVGPAAGNPLSGFALTGEGFSLPLDQLFEQFKDLFPSELRALKELAPKDPVKFMEKIGLQVYLPIIDRLISTHPEMIYIRDRESRMLYVNDAYVRTYGKPRASIIGQTDETLFGPEHYQRTRPEDVEVMRTKAPTPFEGAELWPDGRIHYVKSTRGSLDIAFMGSELCIGTFGVCDDLTFSKERAIFNAVPSGIVLLQPRNEEGSSAFTVLDMNQAAQKIGGTTKEAAFRKPIDEVLPHIAISGLTGLLDAVSGGRPQAGDDMERFKKPFKFFVDQKETWWSGAYAQRITGDEILLVFTDDTANRVYDQLTGVKNEESFKETVSRRLKDAGQTAIISIGIKDIEGIGKVSGLDARNELIKSVARLLKDIAAALPGAEIARGINGLFFLYPGSRQNVQAVTDLANRIAAALRDFQKTLDWAQGISLYPSDGRKIAGLLQKCIIAFDNAKPRTITSYDQEMYAHLLEASIRKGEILDAIAKKEFFGVVQPLVSSDGRISKAEYLIRWKKDGAVLSPGLFIRQAQEANLMIELGSLVLDDACRAIRDWEEAGLDDFSLSVNVDPQQVSDGLVSMVGECLERHGIVPRHLYLEVTESGFESSAEGEESVAENELNGYGRIIQKIRETFGVKISIDDFGKENSSLSRLQYLPADVIKIDKLYADRLLKPDPATRKTVIDPFGVAIYGAIVNFAKLIHAEIVAEGVESREQYDILKELGISYYQGFLFFKPMELGKFGKLLASKALIDFSAHRPWPTES
jgi:EAL domain-containing protein (putative c-di-GMP-specific phosphodiesterase class I)/PAS domain-containing protein